jgi:hypothetical protein
LYVFYEPVSLRYHLQMPLTAVTESLAASVKTMAATSVSIRDHVVELERLSWDAGRRFYLDWFENLAEEWRRFDKNTLQSLGMFPVRHSSCSAAVAFQKTNASHLRNAADHAERPCEADNREVTR